MGNGHGVGEAMKDEALEDAMEDPSDQCPSVAEENAVRERALRLLASREHSRLELERKLRAKGHHLAAIARVLDELSATDLVSNQRTAEALAAARSAKGYGPLRLRQELRQRGLEEELIAPLLERDRGDWLDLLVRVAEKKFGSAPASDPKDLARRARFLEYRGFPPELVRRYLRGDLE